MMGVFGGELALPQIEKRQVRAVVVLDAGSEEPGQVQGEEEREIGQDTSFAGIEVQKGVLDKIEKIGIGLRLFETFLQQLHHEQRYGILQHVEEDVLVDDAPFEFADTL